MTILRTTDSCAANQRLKLGEMLRRGARRLRPVSDSPRLDCELLLAHALGVDRAALYAQSEEALSSRCLQAFDGMLGERIRGRPVAQILGYKEFYSLHFEITREVLSPRPETELLVEVLSEAMGEKGRHPHLLDLGTGSGAVAISLARLLPQGRITATDISAAALDVATGNAARLAPKRIHFLSGSWYEPIDEQWRFDAIGCNPPYVESDLCGHPPLKFEPNEALDGGPDGLRQLRAVVAGAPAHLKPGGILAVEHGARQGKAVREMMRQAGLGAPVTHRDLAGHERVTEARSGSPRSRR